MGMKPGDVVEFKDGLWGLAAPENLGILVDRYRVKGTPWVKVATVQGVKEAKAEHLRKRTFKVRYDGRLDDAASLAARLRQILAQNATGGLAEEPEDDLAKLEQALWEATCDAEPRGWTEEEIAAAYYGQASAQQLRDTRAALAQCRRPGTGRFQTAGKGDVWRPYTRAEYDAMRQAWTDLGQLRQALIGVEAGEAGDVYRGQVLDAPMRAKWAGVLSWVQAAMEQYVLWDGVPDGERVAGIGGLGAVRAFGMDLHRQLGFLAQDWLGAHTTTSSDYIQFLLGMGLWTPSQAVDALIRRHVNQEEFFEHEVDAEAEAEAAKAPEPEWSPDRTDLRHLPCYTIDPADAKDFDDAVGLEMTPSGRRLWVHVADVSHYVVQDSKLDRHAKRRATSVYLPGRVLPMLPSHLSDHLCSLRSDGPRHALSVAMDVDASGRIVSQAFHVATIQVTENLSYLTALTRAGEGVSPFVELLQLAADMRRHRRGLALDTGERKVLVRDEGFEATEKRGDAMTQMIETFMVAANEAVAKHLTDAGIGLLYRCHPLPEATKAERLQHQLETMGLEVAITLPRAKPKSAPADTLLARLKSGGGKLNLFGGGITLGGPEPEDEVEPASAAPPGFAGLSPEEQDQALAPFRFMTQELATWSNRELADVATLKVLGAMGRAYYTPKNEGHFGLASTHYCHFTSPIRRYPDLVVHRNLKWLIRGRAGTMPHPDASLEAMCDHCSNQEKQAAELERRVKMACMVLASLGQEERSPGRITGITPASLFVLRRDGIEARIAQRDLPGGPFDVDEWESMLLERGDGLTGQAQIQHAVDGPRVRAKLGDQVAVRLASRDVAAGKTGAILEQWDA